MKIEELNRFITDYLRRNVTIVGDLRTAPWIYMDYPRYDATFPRISVTHTSAPTEPIGIGHEGLYFNISYDIDIWIKKGNFYTIDGKKYTGSSLRDYLTDLVVRKLILNNPPIYGYDGSTIAATPRQYFKTQGIYDIKIDGMSSVPYDDEYEIFRKTISITLTIAQEVS